MLSQGTHSRIDGIAEPVVSLTDGAGTDLAPRVGSAASYQAKLHEKIAEVLRLRSILVQRQHHQLLSERGGGGAGAGAGGGGGGRSERLASDHDDYTHRRAECGVDVLVQGVCYLHSGRDTSGSGTMDAGAGSVPSNATAGVRDVSFRLSAGTLTLVCGQNGSGKSTLLTLLAAMRTPTEGTVTIAGVDTRLVPLRSARRLVASQPQSASILVATAAANLRRAREQAT